MRGEGTGPRAIGICFIPRNVHNRVVTTLFNGYVFVKHAHLIGTRGCLTPVNGHVSAFSGLPFPACRTPIALILIAACLDKLQVLTIGDTPANITVYVRMKIEQMYLYAMETKTLSLTFINQSVRAQFDLLHPTPSRRKIIS